jgi:FkbM family methyltransferase
MAEHETGEADLSFAPFGTHKPNLLQSLILRLAFGTVFGRGDMRRWLSYLVAKLGAPIDVTRMGCKFRLYLSNNLIDFGILLRAGYNGREIEFLTDSLGAGSVAIDIGSNVGLYSLPLGKTGAQVIAIEANPRMATQLSFLAKENDFQNVTVLNIALGLAPGRADLQIRYDDVAIVQAIETPTGAVEMRTLGDILQEAGADRIDSLKIDIEGYEDRAFAPFLETCPDHLLPKRIVIEEYSDADNPRCQAAFKQRGYERLQRTRNNTLYRLQA